MQRRAGLGGGWGVLSPQCVEPTVMTEGTPGGWWRLAAGNLVSGGVGGPRPP